MDAPHHHATFEALRAALEELRSKLLANQMEHAKQIDGLHKAIESMASEAAAERETAEQLTRAAEDKVVAFVAYLQDIEDEGGQGAGEAHALNERIADLEEKLAESERKSSARQQEQTDEAAAGQAARDRVAKLERELADKDAEAAVRVEALERSLKERTDAMEHAAAVLEEANARREASEARAATLESARAVMEEELGQLREERAGEDAAIADLQADHERQREALDALALEKTALLQKVSTLETAADEAGRMADAEMAELKADHDSQREALEALAREKAQLLEKVSTLEAAAGDASRVAELEETLEKTRKDLDEQRIRGDMLEQQVRDETAKGTKSSLAEQLAEALRDADQAREELRVLRATRVRAQEPPDQVQWPEDPMARLREASQHLEGSHRRTLGTILVDAGVVSQQQVDEALDEQRFNPQTHVGTILVDRGHVSEEAVGLALACQSQVDFVALNDETVDPQAPALVSERLAQKHTCVPIQASVDTVVLAMANPLDLVAIEDVERASNRKAEVVVATKSDIMNALERYYWEPE